MPYQILKYTAKLISNCFKLSVDRLIQRKAASRNFPIHLWLLMKKSMMWHFISVKAHHWMLLSAFAIHLIGVGGRGVSVPTSQHQKKLIPVGGKIQKQRALVWHYLSFLARFSSLLTRDWVIMLLLFLQVNLKHSLLGQSSLNITV